MSDSINLGDSVYRAQSTDKIVQRLNDEHQNHLAVGAQINEEEKDKQITTAQEVEKKEDINNEEKEKKRKEKEEQEKKEKERLKLAKEKASHRPDDGHIVDFEA